MAVLKCSLKTTTTTTCNCYGKSRLNVLKKNWSIFSWEIDTYQTIFEAPGERALTWHIFHIKMASLYTQTFLGNMGDSPVPPAVGHPLPTQSASAKKSDYRNLASPLSVLAGGEHGAAPWLSALLCFVFQIVMITSVPYLSFSTGILFTGVPETTVSVKSPQRWQKARRPRIWPVCRSLSQRRSFQCSRQASPSDSGWGTGNGVERIGPCLGKLQKRRCSFSHVISSQGLPTSSLTEVLLFSKRLSGGCLLPFHSLDFSFPLFLSRFPEVRLRAALPVSIHHYFGRIFWQWNEGRQVIWRLHPDTHIF